jgi:hypothetical protein
MLHIVILLMGCLARSGSPYCKNRDRSEAEHVGEGTVVDYKQKEESPKTFLFNLYLILL